MVTHNEVHLESIKTLTKDTAWTHPPLPPAGSCFVELWSKMSDSYTCPVTFLCFNLPHHSYSFLSSGNLLQVPSVD